MAARKLTYSEMMAELEKASTLLTQKYSHAYAHGVYQSSLASAIVDLPRHKQLEILRVITGLANKED